MENICVAEALSSSSNPSCDERTTRISSIKVTSNCMAATNRPCDPRDFKKSRAYQYKTLDQNAFQLDRKMAQERSMVFLDRSILTPITDGDQVNDIKMTTNSTVECDVISEEAVIDLAIDNSVDMCMPEAVDMVMEKMDVDDNKKEENAVVENSVTVIEAVTDEQKIEAKEDRKEEVEDKVEMEENRTYSSVAVVVVEDKIKAEVVKEDTGTAVVVGDKMEMEDSVTILDDTMVGKAAKESNVVAVEKEEKMEIAEDRTENNVVVEGTVENEMTTDENKEDNKMEVDKVKESVDKPEIEIPMKEQVKVEDHTDTVANVDSSNKSPVISTTGITNSTLTVSRTRVKSEPFLFNPGPIDDDLSLPSCKELSNQVLCNNFLRDIENLSESVDIQLPINPSINRVLNKPLIPSCSAFRSSVLSNVTSTVKSGSSMSISGKQSTKDSAVGKSLGKNSSPRKVVHKTPEKSVSKKSASKKNSESSLDDEKMLTTPVALKPPKAKPVDEQVRKYSTRRSALLMETEHVPQTKPSPPVQEKVRDVKLSPNKHTNLQSSGHKDKMKSKPSQLANKTSKLNKSPSKTPTRSPSKTTPTRTLSTQQSEKLRSSPRALTSSTPHSTRSHTKSITKATASSSDPIPVWITWKCCLCSRGGSQDHLGFLYGPYKSHTDDTVSTGSKRTHDETDNDSGDEKQASPELWVHEGCACWAPGVCLVGSELHGLAEAVKNAKDMECVGCHQPGATISCSNRGCKASFHYPCAIRAGCSLLPDQLLLLCHTHNTQEKTV